MIDDPLNRMNVKRGMQLPQAKLTDDDVKKILKLVERREKLKKKASSMKNANLAKQFGVHTSTIDRITQGFGWLHIT